MGSTWGCLARCCLPINPAPRKALCGAYGDSAQASYCFFSHWRACASGHVCHAAVLLRLLKKRVGPLAQGTYPAHTGTSQSPSHRVFRLGRGRLRTRRARFELPLMIHHHPWNRITCFLLV